MEESAGQPENLPGLICSCLWKLKGTRAMQPERYHIVKFRRMKGSLKKEQYLQKTLLKHGFYEKGSTQILPLQMNKIK